MIFNEQHEQWCQVVGYEGRYDVSSRGRVRSLLRNSILRPRVQADIYASVVLRKDGKASSKRVSRLVLEAFSGSPQKGFEAAHQNGNRADDRIENLKWMTPADNCKQRAEHGTQLQGERVNLSKLKDDQVREIRRLFTEGMLTTRQIATRFGISKQNALSIRNRATWKHI